MGADGGAYFDGVEGGQVGEPGAEGGGEGGGAVGGREVVDGGVEGGGAGGLGAQVDQARESAGEGADLLAQDDLTAGDGKDRLDRERAADQRGGGVDATAAAQVLQGVHAEQHGGAGRRG